MKASHGSGRTWSGAAVVWEHFYPSLQRVFPEQLGSVPIAVFHRAINKVARSSIRTDADEVTYNLHIILRFNLELKLLEGELCAKDLPEAWRAAMKTELGVAPADDRDGMPTGRPLVLRLHRRAISELHDRQYFIRAVLCDGAAGTSQHPQRNRQREVRHTAHLAAR
jgi:Carboxypeptidase Taq (M32) metallopeptidase